MNISIVIPNYNGEKITADNLPRIFEAIEHYKKSHTDSVEIVIVDDCSTDNSVSVMTEIVSRYRAIPSILIKNEKNLGFSSAVNKGFGKSTGELVVLLNTDVVPQKDFLSFLLPHFRKENIFAVGCLEKDIENSKTTLRGRGIGIWRNGFLIHKRGEVNKTSTLWVSGGSSAFRKSYWERLGGLDSLYNPFYWEDIDLSYRALKSGYDIIFDPESIVTHKHQEGAIRKSFSPFAIKKIAYRNQFLFVWKNATDPGILFNHFVFLPFLLLRSLIKRDIAFLAGFFYAVVHIRSVISSRQRAARLFKKRDSEVVKDFFEEFSS